MHECKVDYLFEAVRLVLLQLHYCYMQKNSRDRFTHMNAFVGGVICKHISYLFFTRTA